MRIVIKLGTSTLTHATGHLNIRRVELLAKVISDIKNAGHQVILVSSGAIGMGVGKLGLRCRPTDIPTKQAAAAVGQCELMYIYDKLFGDYHHTVAQLLITGDDVKNEQRHQNFSNTLNRLLELGALPILNENDTVATDEIVIGDNDTQQHSAHHSLLFHGNSSRRIEKICHYYMDFLRNYLSNTQPILLVLLLLVLTSVIICAATVNRNSLFVGHSVTAAPEPTPKYRFQTS